MRLAEVSAPQGAFDEFKKRLRPPSATVPGPVVPVTNTQESSKPHPIYHINLADLIEKKNLSGANISGWRFFQKDERDQLCAYEIRTEKDSQIFQFNGKVIGDNVQRHFNILLNQINNDPSSGASHPIPDDEYTHSFLRAGAAKILAVWLKHSNSENDLFIPMDPVFHNLVANKIYSESEFLPILIEAAEKALAVFQQTSQDNLRGG